MAEFTGFLDGFLQPLSVLDVAGVVADTAVEDVLEGIFPQELVAQDPHAPCILEVHPQVTQIRNRINIFLLFRKFGQQLLVLHSICLQNRLEILLLPFNIRDDGLSIVFWDIFSFVFYNCADLLIASRIVLGFSLDQNLRLL